MMKKLTGKGERVREKMIETTVHILQQQGFKKATVRSIAKAAGVNIASVRYYFGSKEELIGAALEYMMGNLENIVSFLDDNRLTASERLKKYIIAYFHLAREHPALFRSISNPSSEDAKDTYFIYLSLLHSQCWEKVIRNVAEVTGYTDEKDLELKAIRSFWKAIREIPSSRDTPTTRRFPAMSTSFSIMWMRKRKRMST